MADIGDYIHKLVHPIAEIRERTLGTLLQKVEFGLVSISRLCQHPKLLENLLRLLDLGPHTLRGQILKLLQYTFQDESSRSRFDALGGTQYLQSLKLVAPLELVAVINNLLQNFQHSFPGENTASPTEHPVQESDGPYLPSKHIGFSSSTLTASLLDDTQHIGVHQQINDPSIDDSCACDIHDQDQDTTVNEPPITFSTFPWQALTSSDRRVLESTTLSLLSHDESIVISSLHFLDTVVLKDFPAEVLLQRPAVVRAVYGCVEEESETAWRVQGPACACLLTLTQLLNDRVSQFTDPHLSPSGQQTVTPTSSGIATPSTDITRGSCCSSDGSQMGDNGNLPGVRNNIRHLGDGQDRSGSIGGLVNGLSTTSVHEDDDGDEFILLGMHQSTVSGHCSHVLRVTSPLLVAKRPSLQSISLRLLLSCLKLLQQCVNPQMLWKYHDEEEILIEITGAIKRAIKSLSSLLVLNYEVRKSYGDTSGLEDPVLNNQCLMLLLCRILKLFVPLEAFKQIIDLEISASLILVLCDGGFYLGYRSQYNLLLQYLSQVLPDIAAQIKCILFAAKALEATATFLQTSSSQLGKFIKLADEGLAVASIHQSSVFVEKFVRGSAKQIALGNIEGDHLERLRNLLLQVLHFPDVTIRLGGYTSVLRLVEDSVGISQAGDTSQSRSSRIIILLSPSVISCLVYSGLTDDNSKVITISQNILLGLMKGHLLMNASVWCLAAECWRCSLPHLRGLADSITNLGRAVTSLVGELYNGDQIENLEVLKFHLHCLFALDRQTRIHALSEVLQRLAFSPTRFLPDPREVNPTVHHDLFILKQPVQLLLTGNLASERGRLLKVVELIQSVGVENAVRKAAWSQLAFLLEDPQLHKPFFQLFSLQYLVINFIGMMKQDGSMNLTVDFLPGALDTLRLLATHSSSIRLTLAKDEEFLLCLVRAAFLYYADDRTRSQASCLMALLLLNDVMVFSSGDTAKNGVTLGGKDFVSVPELLVSKIHLPFICDTYTWYDKGGLCQEIRTVHQILQEEDWEVMKFLKVVWASACQGGIENIDSEQNKATSFSVNLKLSENEISIIRLSVLRFVFEKFLINIENGTSHQDVKRNLNVLSFHMLQFQLTSDENEDLHLMKHLNQCLHRFIICQPNSSVDEQLLTHVLNMIYVSLTCQKNKTECLPILHLLIGELTKLDTALHHTLRITGSVSWVASDPNPRALLSVRLFRTVTNLISLIAQISQDFDSTSNFWTKGSRNQLASNIVLSLLPVLKPNNDNEPQYYNLVVLGCALECLAHVTAVGWPGDEMSSQLVSCLTRIIKTFHEGRGRAHNSYMGRMVTLSSSLTLIHLLSHPKGDLTQEISEWCNREGSLDWSWLVSLWVYRDPSITSVGLSVASSLASRPEGTCLLHESLTQVSGGVWGAALSYLLAIGRSCLVRTSAAELLVKLTENKPTTNDPWTSPIVTDTLTGESVGGVEALMILLQHCNFYNVMRTSFSKLWLYPDQPDVNLHQAPQAEWDFSISHLSSFYTPADDDPGSVESHSDEEWGNGKSSLLVSVPLYETLVRLLTNILLLHPYQVIRQLSSHGVIQMVIKQLRYLVPLMKTSAYHFQAVEMVLVLLCAVLKYDSAQALSLARDTSLVHLTVAVLTSGIEKARTRIVCLELLNGLSQGGGWGISQIIDWIAASPALTLRPLVFCLHSSAPLELQIAAASFLISLLQSVFHDEVLLKENFESTLAAVLDMPVKLLNDQDVCPGWELCRHLIQLVCCISDIREPPSQTIESKKELSLVDHKHQHLLLESLKLVLLISQSAKEAAHHFRLFFMPILTKPFSDLQESIQTLNVHITTQLMSKKELKEIILKVIQHLEVATNWVEGRGLCVDPVGESLVPLLHPLWAPTLRTPSLLTATLKFLLAASAHHQVCLYLNRTSGLPGVLLSASRTGRPLLACVTTAVIQQLSRLPDHSRGSTLGFKDLPKENFILSISILTNCARLQECTSVMSKLDLVNSIMKWLDCRLAFEEGMNITPLILRLFVVLTSHNEPQMSVCKSKGWVSTLHELLQHSHLRKDALVAIANMSRNHHAARSLLGSEDFVKAIIGVVGQQENDKVMSLALVIIWALIANNKRGQAVIKQYPLQPTLKYLIQIQDHQASLCQKILDILIG